MSKYTDILGKKYVDQTQENRIEPEQTTVTPSKRIITRPPSKKENCNYDRWERSYFSHLVNMYRIFCDDETAWDPPEMYQFFLFIYNVSSGDISEYLDRLEEEQYERYFEYKRSRYSI